MFIQEILTKHSLCYGHARTQGIVLNRVGQGPWSHKTVGESDIKQAFTVMNIPLWTNIKTWKEGMKTEEIKDELSVD